MNMRAKILGQIESLNKLTESIFKELESYSEAALNARPHPNSWSALQNLNHLVLSEKLSLAYCNKKLSFNPKLKKAGVSSALGSLLVNASLRSPIKVKAPINVGSEALPLHDTLASIRKTWGENRTDMKDYIENLENEYIDRAVYKHPFGSRLSLLGMVSFFKAHMKRHRRQLRKALKEVSIQSNTA